MEEAYKTFFDSVGAKVEDKNIRAADEVISEIRTLVDFVRNLAVVHELSNCCVKMGGNHDLDR